MEFSTNEQGQELLPLSILSKDEIMTIRGAEYNRLPNSFTMSPLVNGACEEIWSYFQAYDPSLTSKVFKRFANLLQNIKELSSDEAIQSAYKIRYERQKKENEFGLQFYSDGVNLVKGQIHSGRAYAYSYGHQRDGIPDGKTVIFIHNHPDDMTLSVGDAKVIVADERDVPRSWLYFAVGPTMYHLMFPTLDTPRHDPKTFRQTVAKEFGHIYDEAKSTGLIHGGQVDLMKAIAAKYRLGYYMGAKGLSLPRVV